MQVKLFGSKRKSSGRKSRAGSSTGSGLCRSAVTKRGSRLRNSVSARSPSTCVPSRYWMFASVWKPASAANTAPASTSLGEAQLAKRRSRPLQHRHQQRVLLGFAEGLRVHHDLMLAVHDRHPVVALDDPLRGLHLGTVVVGEVALLHPPAGPDLVRVALKKPPDLLQRRLEGLDLLAPRHPQRFLVPRRVGVAVTAHQMLNRTFHLRDLLLEVPPG